MTTLREQMAPLLKDFQGQNGRGNLLSANITLMKMVEVLMSHIERQAANSFHFTPVNPANWAAAPQGPFPYPQSITLGQDGFVVGGDVDLNVDLANTPPVVGWADVAMSVTPNANAANPAPGFTTWHETPKPTVVESVHDFPPVAAPKRGRGRPKVVK